MLQDENKEVQAEAISAACAIFKDRRDIRRAPVS